MKKILIFLLAALLLMGSASALDGTGYPAYDGAALPSNALAGSFDADRLLLSFDASSEFSICANGYLQACFYAMNNTDDSYLEIYLHLPQSTVSGDVITPSSALAADMRATCISFYEVRQTQEDFYVAMLNDTGGYPQGADFEIRIDSFVETDIAYCVHGTLTAALMEMKELRPTGRALSLRDVEFDFALPKSAAPRSDTPESSQAPFNVPAPTDAPFNVPDPTHAPFDVPAPTDAPDSGAWPAFTLPPDYAKI